MFANQTLRNMAATDLAALIPSLTERFVHRGEMLSEQGEQIETVFFPTTARLANRVSFSEGRPVEPFMMGLEGASSLAPFMARAAGGWSVEVIVPGLAWLIPADALRRQVMVSGTLRDQFSVLLNDYQTQSLQSVACVALHDLRARLARFLLAACPAESSARLEMTQAELGSALGCRRTTINTEADVLRTLGAIRYRRGWIEIVDRDRLQQQACACFGLQQAMLAR